MSLSNRQHKVADQIQQELAVLVHREVKDPRLGFVTITSVKVSADLSVADVYVSVMGVDSREQAQASLEALVSANGFLRTSLSKRVKLRSVPQLRFHFDDLPAKGQAMSSLIDQALRKGQDSCK